MLWAKLHSKCLTTPWKSYTVLHIFCKLHKLCKIYGPFSCSIKNILHNFFTQAPPVVPVTNMRYVLNWQCQLSRRWQPLKVCSKMFERLFRAGMSDLNHFFLQNIHVWYMKIESVRSFPTRVFTFNSGEAFFADHVILIWGFSSFQEIPRFRIFLASGNSSFQEFLVSGIPHFRFFLKRGNSTNRESCCKDDWAQSCYNIKC